MKVKKQKIFVGISGGVDSSVAAYLLKKEGHEVHGVFVKTWSPEWLPCTWMEEKRDAMRVCARLDIPFHFLDAEEAYKRGVADYMIAEYAAGRTPNPDVLCNRVIKFGVLWEYARSCGGNAVATGHYARTDGVDLLKGVDPAKDQVYFLWMLRKDELPHVRFPIGHMQKSEVRVIAKKAGLFTSFKKDSQGICFLGDVDMKSFLLHYIDQKKGDVVNEKGESVGEHDGVWFYTLGERHGFRIHEKNSKRVAYYVTGKDIERNMLIVSPKEAMESSSQTEVLVRLTNINWLTKPQKGKIYTCHLRYHGEPIPVSLKDDQTIRLFAPLTVSLGQSVVIYDKETVVGGGILDKVL